MWSVRLAGMALCGTCVNVTLLWPNFALLGVIHSAAKNL